MTAQARAADPNSTAAANRAGQMTPDQQKWTAVAVRAEASPGLYGMGAVLLLVGMILLAAAGNRSMHLAGYLFFGGLFMLAALFMARLVWRRAQRLQEVREGHLERATGHIIWERGAYRAEVPGRTLNLTGFNLAAGTYDFSFLPRSGRVVAVELAAADTPAQARDELLHALAMANHFNTDDLPAFRQGQLGRASARRLRQVWSTTAGLLLGAVLALLLFVAIVNTDGSKDLAPLMFVIGLLLGIGALGAALGAVNPTLDALGGRVAAAQGDVQKTIRQTYGRGASTFYYYKLDSQTWSVSAQAYGAFITGPRYRVYYLPRSKQLVGIEPIDEAQ